MCKRKLKKQFKKLYNILKSPGITNCYSMYQRAQICTGPLITLDDFFLHIIDFINLHQNYTGISDKYWRDPPYRAPCLIESTAEGNCYCNLGSNTLSSVFQNIKNPSLLYIDYQIKDYSMFCGYELLYIFIWDYDDTNKAFLIYYIDNCPEFYCRYKFDIIIMTPTDFIYYLSNGFNCRHNLYILDFDKKRISNKIKNIIHYDKIVGLHLTNAFDNILSVLPVDIAKNVIQYI